MRRLLPLGFFLALLSSSMAAPGCATVQSYLPKVTAAVTDAALVLDTIDAFVDRYFAARPNPELQKKVAIAEARARGALQAALATTRGLTELGQAQVDAAFKDFATTYTELLAILAPLGVSSGGKFAAARPGPGGESMSVPMAVELVPQVGGP